MVLKSLMVHWRHTQRALIVVDTDGTIIHTEQVPEIAEPNYEAALAVLTLL
jgi:peroxiredoxin